MWEYADSYKKEQFAVSYITLHEWIYKKQQGRGKISDFYKKYGYEKIAYYGLGTLGDIFVRQTLSEGYPVMCIIDKKASSLKETISAVPVVFPENMDFYKDADAIVICIPYLHNEIADKLVSYGIPEEKILSINEIVFAI